MTSFPFIAMILIPFLISFTFGLPLRPWTTTHESPHASIDDLPPRDASDVQRSPDTPFDSSPQANPNANSSIELNAITRRIRSYDDDFRAASRVHSMCGSYFAGEDAGTCERWKYRLMKRIAALIESTIYDELIDNSNAGDSEVRDHLYNFGDQLSHLLNLAPDDEDQETLKKKSNKAKNVGLGFGDGDWNKTALYLEALMEDYIDENEGDEA